MIIVDKFVNPFLSHETWKALFRASYVSGLKFNLHDLRANAQGITRQQAKVQIFGLLYDGKAWIDPDDLSDFLTLN